MTTRVTLQKVPKLAMIFQDTTEQIAYTPGKLVFIQNIRIDIVESIIIYSFLQI